MLYHVQQHLFWYQLGTEVPAFLTSLKQYVIVERTDSVKQDQKVHTKTYLCSRRTHLLSPLFFSLVLCGLQHLLPPEDKEVRGVCVELKCILLIISIERKK